MLHPQPEFSHSAQVIPASRLRPHTRPRLSVQPCGVDTTEDRSVELAHDARNLISALGLYCELLAAPGVLAPGFGHYADDLRRLAGVGARLIGALAATPANSSLPRQPSLDPVEIGHIRVLRRAFPNIEDLAAELAALEGPLRALVGPEVQLEIECLPCAGQLALNPEDLLRILFNLVANAVEAIASTPAELRRRPFLRITAQRGSGIFLARPNQPDAETVALSVRDNGPGIPANHLPHIFEAGFSTRRDDAPHGLGLAIVRQLVHSAGGAVRAVSPAGLGARFDIELPVLRPEATPTRLELPGRRMRSQVPDLQQISAQNEKEA